MKKNFFFAIGLLAIIVSIVILSLSVIFINGPHFSYTKVDIVKTQDLSEEISIHLEYKKHYTYFSMFGINFGPSYNRALDLRNINIYKTKPVGKMSFQNIQEQLKTQLKLTNNKFYTQYGTISGFKKYVDLSVYISSKQTNSSEEYGQQTLFVFLEKEGKIKILSINYLKNNISNNYQQIISRNGEDVYIYNSIKVDLKKESIDLNSYDTSKSYLSQFNSVNEKYEYILSVLNKNEKLKLQLTTLNDASNLLMYDVYNGNVYVVLQNNGYVVCVVYKQDIEQVLYACKIESDYGCNDAFLQEYSKGNYYDVA